MPKIDVIRAWKDEEYRLSLSDEERAMLPENPAGLIILSETDLEAAAGARTEYVITLGCCGGITRDTCFCSLDCSGMCTIVACSGNIGCYPPPI